MKVTTLYELTELGYRLGVINLFQGSIAKEFALNQVKLATVMEETTLVIVVANFPRQQIMEAKSIIHNTLYNKSSPILAGRQSLPKKYITVVGTNGITVDNIISTIKTEIYVRDYNNCIIVSNDLPVIDSTVLAYCRSYFTHSILSNVVLDNSVGVDDFNLYLVFKYNNTDLYKCHVIDDDSYTLDVRLVNDFVYPVQWVSYSFGGFQQSFVPTVSWWVKLVRKVKDVIRPIHYSKR